jgi:hypothetical protein
MPKATIINSLVGLAIVAAVAAVFVFDGRGSEPVLSAASTTTTSIVATTSTSTTTTSSSTTTSSTTTIAASTTTMSTVPPTTDPPLPRELWKVIVVNGTIRGERLQPTVDLLRTAGYADVRGLVGAVRATETVIYYLLDGQQSAAERLRDDIQLGDVAILSFDDAPPVAGRNDAQLMLYLGGS